MGFMVGNYFGRMLQMNALEMEILLRIGWETKHKWVDVPWS